MIVLVEIMARNRATGLRTAVRISSTSRHDQAEANGKNGVVWTPAITGKSDVSLRERAFNGGFAEPVTVPTASMSFSPYGVKAADGTAATALSYQGATVTVYAAFEPTASWPWPVEFMGRVTSHENSATEIKLSLSVNDSAFKKSVLSTYAGAGGLEGDAAIKGTVKPWVFGTAQNVEPVLINAVDNVWQFSAYGPIKSVLKLYERASDYGASTGDYANYAALVAAAIPAGGWGSCKAEGLIRLGAPAFGVITGDIEGDFNGSVFRTKPGAILQRVASHLGISASLNNASLDAFDTHQGTRPSGGHVDVALDAQLTFIDLAQQILTATLGQTMISRKDGKLAVCRPSIGSASLTLDSNPIQIGIPCQPASEREAIPFSRVQVAGVRSWRVHTEDEIALVENPVLPTDAVIVDTVDKLATIETGADVTADQPIVSRINPVTGNALGTFAASDGLPYNRIVANGEARNGDVVSFSLPSTPKITFGFGGNAATAGQNIVIAATGLTATGFTMRAVSQSVTPGTTVVDGSSTNGGVGEPAKVINRTSSSDPFDGRFVFRYSVTVGNIAPGEPGNIEVGLYAKKSGAWVLVGSAMHNASGTYSYAATPGTVDFGAGSEFGASKLDGEGAGTVLGNLLDVTYTPGSVTETSLTPSSASPIAWEARL